ncbi:MAG: hypothetical protein IT385_20990 [Deltaproteobacteria bacterium]|nr:hypothetical protein [Deltaproteobacteria bacterium]
MTAPTDTKNSAVERALEKSKDARPASGSPDSKSGGGADVSAVVEKIMAGDMLIETALGAVPGLIPALQKKFGNDAVAKLMDADKKDRGDAASGKEGGKTVKVAGKDIGKDAGAAAKAVEGKAAEAKSKSDPGEKGGMVGMPDPKYAGVGKVGMADPAAKGGAAKAGADVGKGVGKFAPWILGGKVGFVVGGIAGKMLADAKAKVGAAKQDEEEEEKKGGAFDAVGKGAAKAATDTAKGKSESAASKDGKVEAPKKGEDPGKKVGDALKKDSAKTEGAAKAGLGGAFKLVGLGAVAGAIKGGAKSVADIVKGANKSSAAQANDKKNDDSLSKTIDDKAADKNESKDTGGSKGTADAVLDKAKDVNSKKDDGADVGKKVGDASKDGKEAKADPSKEAKGADATKGGAKAGQVAGQAAKDAKAGSDGKDPQAGKDAKGDGGAADPTKADPAKDEAAAKNNPVAQDAQKAKDEASKDGGGGGGPGGGPGAEGKEGGGGAGGAGPGAEGKEAAGGAGGGPGGEEAGKEGAGGGGGAAPAAPTVKGTLDQYMKSHPDPEAAKRVESQGFANDKLGRDANVLKSNVQPPPDKSWMDAVTPRQEWFAFKKGVLGPNKWTGQDAALDFMTRLNAALDSIGGAASKIGLAATIGGAILTLLVPPVGAFLLAVGRVCNAISLVCSAMRIVTSIVSTIMLAVKAAKEKDPLKRLEMMQEMKQNVQAGVMAGLDVIMSKLGGKGGGGAAKGVGSKALDSAKAAFKEGFKAGGKGAMGVVKGVVKGTIGFVKEGAKAAFQGIKQTAKDFVGGVKGQINMMKQLGVKGTLTAMGKGVVNTVKAIGSGIKDTLKEKFVKPFTDLRSAWQSCGNFRQNMRDFRTMITANGGGFSGYMKTLGQINFPNFAKNGNWKEKVASVWGDMTNVSKGGYASQVMAGIEGKESKHEYYKGKDGKELKDKNGLKIMNTGASTTEKNGKFEFNANKGTAGGQFAADKLEELNKLKKIADSGTDVQKRKELHGDTKQGVLANELHARGEKKSASGDGKGGLADRHSAYKNSVGSQGTSADLNFQMKEKVKEMEDSFKMVNPSWAGMAWNAGTGAYAVSQGKAEWGDVGRSMAAKSGTVGSWAGKTFGGEDSETKSDADKKDAADSKAKWGDWGQVKLGGGYKGGLNTVGGTVMNTISAAGSGKSLEAIGKTADDNRAAAVSAYQDNFVKTATAGVTAGKVNAATSPALQLVKQRENEIKQSMVTSGPKTASIGAGVGGGAMAGGAMAGGAAGAAAGAAAEVKQPPPPPPPPPAPPEGTTVPSLDLLPKIAAERAKIAKIKASVEADIKASEEIKTQAIGADAKMTEYAAGLGKQATEIGAQKQEATKDVADVQKAKGDIGAGGKQVGEKKTAAEGEKAKTEAKASEGKGVQNPQVDEAKKQAEERKKAAEEKAAWDREYASAGFLKRRWMNVKKFVGGVFSWVAKAAKWVWEKIIKVAIEAVKKAVAKVMGFITDLMMKGILSLVKCFLSKEEGARLDETMAQMKQMEAEQAKKGTEEAGAKNEEAKMKLTGAQQAAKAKIDHAQGNITTGKGLLAQADQNKAALDQEEADIKAKNEGFKAQYTPYFDWVAKYEAGEAGGGAGGAGGAAGGGGAGAAAAGAAGAAVGAAADKAKGDAAGAAGGAGGAAGGAKDGAEGKGAADSKGGMAPKTTPANEGGKGGEGKQEHPADKKMDPAIAAALANAVAIVMMDSKGATGQVQTAAGAGTSKVGAIAGAIGTKNAGLIQAAGKGADQGKLAGLIAEEKQKSAGMIAAAKGAGTAISGTHAKGEAERQSRLQALASKAAGLSGKGLMEGLLEAQSIAKELAKEASGIDNARNEAMTELSGGFKKSLGGR